MIVGKGHGFLNTQFEPQNNSVAFISIGKRRIPCLIVVIEDKNDEGFLCRFRNKELAEEINRLGYGHLTSPNTIKLELKKLLPINNLIYFTKIMLEPAKFFQIEDFRFQNMYTIESASDAIWLACAQNKKLDEKVSRKNYEIMMDVSAAIGGYTNNIIEKINFAECSVDIWGEEALVNCNNSINSGIALGYEKIKDSYRLYINVNHNYGQLT